MARASSRRYAQAAFSIAVDRGALERWRVDIAKAAEIVSDPDVMAFMASPFVPLAERLNGVNVLLTDIDPTVRNIWSLLVSNGDVEQTRAIAESFQELADEHLGIGRADVITAVPLSGAQRARLKANLRDLTGLKRIEISERVDGDVLGGLVARVGDRLIDGSARTRLRSMRSVLSQRPIGI